MCVDARICWPLHAAAPSTGAPMDKYRLSDCALRRTVEWVSRNGFRRVVLQFPDDLLGASVPLAAALQRSLDAREECGPSRVFVLADTSQNPLCVDEVAAAHVDADAAVHYGRSDLSPVTRLPTLLVFGRERVDAGAVARAIAACAAEGGPSSHPVAFVDQPLVHATEAIVAELRVLGSDGTVSFATVAATELWPAPGTGVTGCCRGGSEGCVSGAEPKEAGCSHDGRGQVQGPGDGEGEGTEAPACVAGYSLPRPDRDMEGVSLVWVGEEGPALTQLQMTLHRSRWTRVDASGATHAADMGAVQRAVGARYFLIDKARDANIVGVLVGTLGVAGFRHVVGRVRALAAGAGKKAYTVLVGKPNPAKLANFPEVPELPLPYPSDSLVTSTHWLLVPMHGRHAFGYLTDRCVGDGVFSARHDSGRERVFLQDYHAVRGGDRLG